MVAVELGDLLHVPDTEVGVGGTLIDAEQHLSGVHRVREGVQPVVFPFAAFQPAQRPLTAGFGVVVWRRVLHALVKRHGDVAAQIGLDTHALLRPHEDAVTVQMAGKGDALLADLPQTRQRKHLKAAGIREDRTVPAHELVEAAHGAHHVVAGAQVQVVGVGQLDLRAQTLLQINGTDAALDGCLCAHVHKDRRLYLTAVGAGEHAAPRFSLFFDDLEHNSLRSQ